MEKALRGEISFFYNNKRFKDARLYFGRYYARYRIFFIIDDKIENRVRRVKMTLLGSFVSDD